MTSPLAVLQPLGRALMTPIAVLPLAGLLLRIGQPDLLNVPFVADAGDAVFANLGLIFAIGVAMGLARNADGAAALAGAICFLVATAGAKTLVQVPPDVLKGSGEPLRDLLTAAFKAKALAKLSTPLGVLSGVIAGDLYNRFSGLRLPDSLAFFGGRRFVPIASGLAGLGLALVCGLGWGAISAGMDALSALIGRSGAVGLFAYGFLNRILIVTGLHHILNNVVWFLLGDHNGVTGDLNRFFAGDPAAGGFMTGFFPVMMFGLPAAALAMYRSARPERRAAVGGMLLSLALTACLTGVTEPIEFSFMFLAPALYGLHAILTGAAMVLMNALGVKLGFSFSAGFFDYVLNFNRATRPLMLIPIGLAYGALYYGVFRFVIVRFDLKTPGREADADPPAARVPASGEEALGFIAALGGPDNVRELAACTTRLRLIVAEPALVDESRLKALGAKGVVRPSLKGVQVVLGPAADRMAGEMRALLERTGALSPTLPPRPEERFAVPAPEGRGGRESSSPQGPDVMALLAALGGPDNVKTLEACASRLRLGVAGAAAIDPAAVRAAGARALAKPSATSVHVVIGPRAEAVAASLRALLAP